MNYRGSYRQLLTNAKAAMIAAIEIYSKPALQDYEKNRNREAEHA